MEEERQDTITFITVPKLQFNLQGCSCTGKDIKQYVWGLVPCAIVSFQSNTPHFTHLVLL